LNEMFGDDDDFMEFINSFGINYFDIDEHDTKKENFKETNKLIKEFNNEPDGV
jgi:Cathepsin propeptide inhibitor domain (I29)